MKLLPRNEWVLVRPIVEGEYRVPVGGGDAELVLPDSSAKRSTIGTVVAFGHKVFGLKIGDEVLLTAFGMDVDLGTPLHKDMHYLVREEAVYAVKREE
jgi:hypothetical protein